MIRIAVILGSLIASTAAYAVDLFQPNAQQDDQTSYMPFPWDEEDEES